MATKSSAFKKVIMKLISQTPISIENFYNQAAKDISFDSDDLRSTILKGEYTGEPSWKRNLRNVLQGCKNSGDLVNSPKDHWRLPSPNPEYSLPTDCWDIIKKRAEDVLKTGEHWFSQKQNHEYRISTILKDRIQIERLDEKAKTKAELLESDVRRAIIAINASGGSLTRSTLNYVVAKETAIVFLHPRLMWDNEEDIVVINTKTPVTPEIKKTYKDFGEAPDDNIDELQNFARKVRKGQKKLRDNLLRLYNEKCCISRTGPKNVLQVAHIEPHSISGINDSTNSLLLRSDLHDLFDDNLLAIHPTKLFVFIHPSLKDSEYFKYHQTQLSSRNDSVNPNSEKLSKRWAEISWISEENYK